MKIKVTKTTPRYDILSTRMGGLSRRAINVLKSVGDWEFVGDLAGFSKRYIRLHRGCGPKTLNEIVDFCENAGVYLKDE